MSTMRFSSLNKTNLESGFTLIEVLVVVIMLVVLAGIAAPGWLGFLERRRLSNAQDEIYQAMLSAQNRAQQRSESWQVSIRDGDTLEVAIHRATSAPSLWEPITDSGTLAIDAGSTVPSTADVYSVIFDDKGNFADAGVALPASVTFASERGGGSVRRSVEVTNLIGALRKTNN